MTIIYNLYCYVYADVLKIVFILILLSLFVVKLTFHVTRHRSWSELELMCFWALQRKSRRKYFITRKEYLAYWAGNTLHYITARLQSDWISGKNRINISKQASVLGISVESNYFTAGKHKWSLSAVIGFPEPSLINEL